MQEYEHLLARLQDFLSYEEIINNAEVINAYDYINLLRKEYNKSRKISVSESLVDRIDRGYELIQKRENKKDKVKKEIDFIESIEVFTGKTISKIRIKTSKGESFICRNNESKEMFMTGMKLNYKFIVKYLDEFNRLLDDSLKYLVSHKDEFTDTLEVTETSKFTDGNMNVEITYDSENGVSYKIGMEDDTDKTIDREWLTRPSIKSMISEREKEILKRIPVDIKTLGVLGTKVTERYAQAYKQMQLNKKKYAQ